MTGIALSSLNWAGSLVLIYKWDGPMIRGLLAICGPTHAHHHVASWKILFAINIFIIALVFDPRKHSHPTPTFPGTNSKAPSMYTVVYTFQTLVLVSHLISINPALLSRQNRNHNSDFTGLKRFIKHESDYESLFSNWLVAG